VLDFLTLNFTELTQYFLDANKRLYIVYLASAILIAVPAFIKSAGAFSLPSFLSFLFPKKIFRNKSAHHDVGLLIINKLIKSALFPAIVITMAPVAIGVSSAIESVFGYNEPLQFSSAAIIAIFTLMLFVFDDFTRFYLHYLLHKIPFLWEFHKVHHSAKVLTPLTIYRSHPVESLLYAFRMALTQGAVVGICYYLFGPTLKMYDILGANAFVFIFNFLGSNLRHSHIRISWGDTIENWFISPAQHQIHHSDNPKHFDVNYGTAIALWDRWACSLVKSSKVNHISYGIGVNHPGHNSLLQLYGEPFIKSWRCLFSRR